MNNDELDLLHRYLEVAINPEELQALEQLLRTSAEARGTLRSLATIDAKWKQLATEEVLAAPNDGLTASRLTSRAIPRWLTLNAIASSVIFAAFGWLSARNQSAGQTRQGIARVIRVEGEGKVAPNRIVVDGAELFASDELAMPQGLIELAFRETGVHVIATAPLKLALNSDQHVSLNE